MEIYIANLEAYNNGYLVGNWISLPTTEEEITEIINQNTNNGQTDFAVHDYELPFEINEYESPYKINEICEIIENLKIDKAQIDHIEYTNGVTFKNLDITEIKEYINNIYTMEAETNYQFAENYMYEYYQHLLEEMPWELSYSIDYNTVFKKLEMTMSITQNIEKQIYYYSHQ